MTRAQRGFTLIESMVAMAVMLTGAAAMIGLNRQALFFNGDGRKMTRAAALATDLLTNLERLPYSDPLLSNTNTSNDLDIIDSQRMAEIAEQWTSSNTTYWPDHLASELPTTWPGVTNNSIIAGGATVADSQLQLYWSINETVGATYRFKQVAVIARWPHGHSWRRLVVLGVKPGAPYIP